MVLEEVSPTHIAWNGQNGQQSLRRHGSMKGVTLPEAGDLSGTQGRETSPSTQNMLKNKTELGDGSQLPLHPKSPKSYPRVSQMPPITPRSSSAHQARGAMRPPGYWHGKAPGSVRSGHGPIVDEYRSYSMTQSSYITHSMMNRQPWSPGPYQYSHPNGHVRSKSPFAYPTRLKRPGYRPSSPGLGGFVTTNGPTSYVDYRVQSGLDSYSDGQRSRNASPASMYHMSRNDFKKQKDANRSEPALAYPPLSTSYTGSRPETRRPSPSIRSNKSSSQLSHNRTIEEDSWAQQPSQPRGTVFYDYTEAFEEHSQITQVRISTPQITPEQPTETDEGPALQDLPVEKETTSVSTKETSPPDDVASTHESLPSAPKTPTGTAGNEVASPSEDGVSHLTQTSTPDLVAPTPERSLTLTHDRLSKILSIDDDSKLTSDNDPTPAEIRLLHRKTSIIQGIRQPSVHSERSSSRHASHPWNLDSSYPWDDEAPKLDVIMPSPEKEEKTDAPSGKIPKFRLRIHRASSSTGGTSRLLRSRRSSEDAAFGALDSPIRRLKSTTLGRKSKLELQSHPGEKNSSHDVISSSPLQTRFVETFQHPSQTSPTISLFPPSSGHEVRSFFSDDSSQAQPKGSIRKRLSDFRTKHSRPTSTDVGQSHDRGLLSSARAKSRASGRSSRQSQTSTKMATGGMGKWMVLKRLRFWFHRREEKLRDWKERRHIADTDDEPAVRPYVGV